MKKLIDEYFPLFHFSETHATEVNAPANLVYSSILACDLGRSGTCWNVLNIVKKLNQIGYYKIGR